MICDKVRDVDEISVFICADGIKLVERGDASHRFMSTTVGKCRIYIRRRCDWGASSLRGAKSVPFEELHVVVREGRLGELVYCRT